MEWFLDKILGMDYSDVSKVGEILGMTMRVVKKGEHIMVVTRDYNPTRINLTLSADYIVLKANLG